MGLDMYLYKKTYVQRWSHIEPEKQFEVTVKRGGENYKSIDPERICYVVEQVGYWRKFNGLHRWFVENVQKGEDDCGEYQVSWGKLVELYETMKTLQMNKNNQKVGENLLPTQSGFFFGSTNYDEYYWGDVQETIVILEKCLKGGEDISSDFYYHSSW